MPDTAEATKGILFILGLGVFGGMLGAWFFQKMRVPQVIGYIVIGLIIGESGFEYLRIADIENLQPFNIFALGIIGFLVGGELKLAEFKKYGKQFAAILFGEGVLAFVLVGLCSGLIVYKVSGSINAALAAGCVFGAIASATDPASTVDVLWEYRSKGVLTTSITAIVALDDALAMTLYGLGTGAAQMLAGSGGEEASVLHKAGEVAVELFGAILLGAVAAILLSFLLRWLHQSEKSMAFALGLLLLVIAMSDAYKLDVILAAMTMGFVTANISPHRSESLFNLVRSFSGPIYVLFFVFVGARLSIDGMPGWLWWLVGGYVLFRSAGKMAGAYFGAKLTGSEPVVRKYLGMGLFAQGGVAVGLSIMASRHLSNVALDGKLSLGDAIIFGVTATTLIVQLIGPPMVKLAIRKADESGRNVTDDDVIKSLKVSDVMEGDIKPVFEGESLELVMKRFTDGDYLSYPVINENENVCGLISLGSMKEIITDRDTWRWLLAGDVMLQEPLCATPDMPLQELLNMLADHNLEQLPVVESKISQKPAGMLRREFINKRIAEEVVHRQGIKNAA